MTKRFRGTHGFTLMELMIVVAIAGILSAIAIPTFTMLANRSKTAEVSTELNSMFKCSATYYQSERAAQGAGNVSGFCIVPSTGVSPGGGPKKAKQVFSSNILGYQALGFTIADSVYYAYELKSVSGAGSTCSHSSGEASLYTFSAYGDLDGDSNWSTFELAAGSNGDNILYHSFGFYVNHEME